MNPLIFFNWWKNPLVYEFDKSAPMGFCPSMMVLTKDSNKKKMFNSWLNDSHHIVNIFEYLLKIWGSYPSWLPCVDVCQHLIHAWAQDVLNRYDPTFQLYFFLVILLKYKQSFCNWASSNACFYSFRLWTINLVTLLFKSIWY